MKINTSSAAQSRSTNVFFHQCIARLTYIDNVLRNPRILRWSHTLLQFIEVNHTRLKQALHEYSVRTCLT